MQPTLFSQGVGGLVLLLFLLSLILSDTAFFTVGAVLSLFLLYRALAFDRAYRTFAPSLVIHRAVDNEIICSGQTVTVTTTVSGPVPPMTVKATDLPPPGSSLTSGTPWALLAGGDTTLCYTFRSGIWGPVSFEGLSLLFQDGFFSRNIVLSGEPFRLPRLTVYLLDTVLSGEEQSSVQQEQFSRAGLKDPTVRSFREYRPGDDLRHIDWKLTAKHGRLFTREYSSLTNPPLIVVLDSPGLLWTASPSSAVFRLGAAAVGMIEGGIRSHGVCSLFVISGPNLIHALPMEQNLSTLLQAAGDFPRASGITRLYRAMSQKTHAYTLGAAEHNATVRPPATSEAAFCCKVAGVYKGFLRVRRGPYFEQVLKRALSPFTVGELHLFSTFQGDLSHINLMVETAHHQKLRVTLHMVQDSGCCDQVSHYPGTEVNILQ